MAPSFGCVASSLFCPEDNLSIMCFDDDIDFAEMVEPQIHEHGLNTNHVSWDDFLVGLPFLTDDCVGVLVEREPQHLPREDYIKRLQSRTFGLPARKDAVDWILKVHAYYSFGPLCAYLSINYLDRFLYNYELTQSRPWMMQLLAIACLSLAAKMEETEVPLSLDLQLCGARFIFEAKTIQRMELLVLRTLNWRMQAVTPFSYLDFFLQKINDGKPPARPLIFRSVELILNTLKGIEFTGFRPSEIAAAVAIFAIGETQTADFNKVVSCCIHVEKGRVLKCYELIQEVGLMRSEPSKGDVDGSISSEPYSPIGVLDAACLSYNSDEMTVGSCGNSHSSPAAKASKRRKLNA